MRKLFFLLCLAWAWLPASFAAPAFTSEDACLSYLEEHLELAKRYARTSGIPISICLAQAIHESASGQSTLATQANNHFGIKALDPAKWQGDLFFIEDDDRDPVTKKLKKSPFRKYASPEDSYADYAKFLRSNSRYADLFKIPVTDYTAWAAGLQAAGYATDSLYADHLIEKIERFQLYRFDEEKEDKISLLASYKPLGKTESTAVSKQHKYFSDNDLAREYQPSKSPQAPAPVEVRNNQFTASPAVAPACPNPTQGLSPMQAKPTFLSIQLRER